MLFVFLDRQVNKVATDEYKLVNMIFLDLLLDKLKLIVS